MLFKVEKLNEVRTHLRNMRDMGTSEFSEFLSYTVDITEREILYKNFTDSDGMFHIERMNTDDKAILNSLSSKIARYELKFSKTPIYDALAKKHPEVLDDSRLPDFIRDPRGRWVEEARTAVKGWYQNSVGDLYHYDGVVWDDIPSEKIEELEFLGNG